MKTLKTLLMAMLVIGAMAGCSKGSKAEQMSTKMCDCSKDMMTLMKKMKDNPAEAANLMAEAQESQKKFMDCMGGEDALKKMDEGMKEDEKKKFEEDMKAALNKKCPEVAKEMGF